MGRPIMPIQELPPYEESDEIVLSNDGSDKVEYPCPMEFINRKIANAQNQFITEVITEWEEELSKLCEAGFCDSAGTLEYCIQDLKDRRNS